MTMNYEYDTDNDPGENFDGGEPTITTEQVHQIDELVTSLAAAIRTIVNSTDLAVLTERAARVLNDGPVAGLLGELTPTLVQIGTAHGWTPEVHDDKGCIYLNAVGDDGYGGTQDYNLFIELTPDGDGYELMVSCGQYGEIVELPAGLLA